MQTWRILNSCVGDFAVLCPAKVYSQYKKGNKQKYQTYSMTAFKALSNGKQEE
jgi:hypothetical protein